MHKFCRACKQTKSTTEFFKDIRTKSGFTSNCKQCRSKQSKIRYQHKKHEISKKNKQYYNENKEAVKAYKKAYYKKNIELHHAKARKIERLFLFSKHRSRYRGLEWTITFDEYASLRKNLCFYCDQGLPPVGTGLDRLDNSKGYMLNNVVPCCKACNHIRGDNLTVEEMFLAMRVIKRFRAEKEIK